MEQLDGFTCAIGTGGTLTGVSVGLKNLNKNIHIACTDSQGSSMYNYFTKGNPEKKGDESITEGIGQARITKNLENCIVDSSFFVTDQECMEMLYKLIKTEGLFLGLSSGVNICGAIKLGKKWVQIKKLLLYYVMMQINIMIKCLIKNICSLKIYQFPIGYKHEYKR